MVDQQFTQRCGADYLPRRVSLYQRSAALHDELVTLQTDDNGMECSQQIYEDAKYLINYTCSFDYAARRLDDLQASMGDKDQAWALEQQSDGSWGPCYDFWFNKVGYMIVPLGDLLERDEPPDYPLHFVFNISRSWPRMKQYWNSILVTDILNEALPPVNNREELGGQTGTWHQLVFKSYYREYISKYAKELGFNITDDFAKQYTEYFIGDNSVAQDKSTGMWGERFINRAASAETPVPIPVSGIEQETEGLELGFEYMSCLSPGVVCGPDLSMTFHTVSYNKGHTPNLDRTLYTIRNMREKRYPYGWLTADGDLNNHNSYDIAKILMYGYQEGAIVLGDDESILWQYQCEDMLNFAVNSSISMDEDHCFVMNSFYTSLADAYYFGAQALVTFQYFGTSPDDLFWDMARNVSYPSNQTVCCDATRCLVESGIPLAQSEAAFESLQNGCSQCSPLSSFK